MEGAEERWLPQSQTLPAIQQNQIVGLTDNPPIYLAHSVLPAEGEAKMETQ